MNAYQSYVEAAEHYERLYWANKARIALSCHRTTDNPSIYALRELPPSCIVYDFPARKAQGGRYKPRRIVWIPSTLPRMRGMGEIERETLERQKALAPLVTPKDVADAKRAMSTARKSMQTAQRQLRLSVA